MMTEHVDRPDADVRPDTGHEHGATRSDAPDTADVGTGTGGAPGPSAGAADRGLGTSSPGGRGRRGRGGMTRWLLIGGAAFVAVLLAFVGTIMYGAVRLAYTTDARNDAGSRFVTACEQLETRLNRLIPPGATRGPDERSTAIRRENVAVQPLLDELHGLPARIHTYDTVLTDWEALVSAREKFASELGAQALGERPAFFVVRRDDGADRIKRIFDQSPQICDASVRRLAAPDL